jgi:hypothetical protein
MASGAGRQLARRRRGAGPADGLRARSGDLETGSRGRCAARVCAVQRWPSVSPGSGREGLGSMGEEGPAGRAHASRHGGRCGTRTGPSRIRNGRRDGIRYGLQGEERRGKEGRRKNQSCTCSVWGCRGDARCARRPRDAPAGGLVSLGRGPGLRGQPRRGGRARGGELPRLLARKARRGRAEDQLERDLEELGPPQQRTEERKWLRISISVPQRVCRSR